MPDVAPATAQASAANRLADIARLLIACPDQPGIVAGVAELIRDAGGNIVSLDQYSDDPVGGRFFQRTEFHLAGLAEAMPELEREIATRIAGRFAAAWSLRRAAQPKRVAIMVSKTDHNLLDLLWRQRQGQLNVEIAMVISNHEELRVAVEPFGIPYHFVPVDRDDRSAAERVHLALLRNQVDLVVLARYMQIITEDFLEQVGVPVINIHHSFLPAFIGAGPYQKAKDRGVKLVGATAHYVTKDLDEGPIIEQDVVRVDHADTVQDLMRLGADVERRVLSRAVAWHCEDRVLVNGSTTIVF